MNSRKHRKLLIAFIQVLIAGYSQLLAQKVQFARVMAKRIERTTELPGEFLRWGDFDTLHIPGRIGGPESDVPLLQLDQISRLRLTVAVPEADVSELVTGTKVDFRVPAYPGRTFSGVLARPAYAVDMKTRTMPVELDVMNPQHLLAPGMYPSVCALADRTP